MDTFAFIATSNFDQNKLTAIADLTNKWMPHRDQEFKQGVTILPDASCGWFALRLTHPLHPQLVSEAVDDHYGVIAYGEVYGSEFETVAEAVLNTWNRGGADQIAELNGSFGAAIIDRRERAVTLVSDIIGHRTLRYFHHDDVFVASPHDLTLVATGYVPLEFDPLRPSAIAVNDWSWGGKSLLRQVSNSRGGDRVIWRGGGVQHQVARVIDPGARINAADESAIKRNLDEMVDVARENIRAIAKTATIVHTDLTAGQDSRAILALLLAELPTDRIVAHTAGGPESLDVRVAARVARMYGVRHQIGENVTSYAGVDEFMSNVDALAFSMNGDTDAKRAATRLRRQDVETIFASCNGAGSAILRGFYYPQSNHHPRPTLTDTDVTREVSREQEKAARLPWSSPAYLEFVIAQPLQCIREFSEQAQSGYDLLDLYYLRERYAVWGALMLRSHLGTYRGWRQFIPLINPRLVRLCYRMPSPIGDYAAYNQECIRRFTPRAYWVRVNDKKLLPLKREGRFNRALFQIDQVTHHFLKRVRGRLNRGRTSPAEQTPDKARASAFAGPLFEYLEGLLTEESSFSVKLFGAEGVRHLLKEHRARTYNHMALLGRLVTAEHYRKMIEGAAREAKEVKGLAKMT